MLTPLRMISGNIVSPFGVFKLSGSYCKFNKNSLLYWILPGKMKIILIKTNTTSNSNNKSLPVFPMFVSVFLLSAETGEPLGSMIELFSRFPPSEPDLNILDDDLLSSTSEEPDIVDMEFCGSSKRYMAHKQTILKAAQVLPSLNALRYHYPCDRCLILCLKISSFHGLKSKKKTHLQSV